MPVGDFTWAVRRPSDGEELALPHVVILRKLNLFGGDIRDGSLDKLKVSSF